jgi:hypothetical protein
MRSGRCHVCIILSSALIFACGKPIALQPKHNNSNLAIPSNTAKASDEHAVLVYIKLADNKFGTVEEREIVMKLGDRLAGLVEESGAGEYDGDEYGGGYCTFYFYGPEANILYEAIRPTLEQRKYRRGSYAIKRFGPPGSKEERFDL